MKLPIFQTNSPFNRDRFCRIMQSVFLGPPEAEKRKTTRRKAKIHRVPCIGRGIKERGRLIYGMTTKNKSDLVGSRSRPLKYSARVV